MECEQICNAIPECNLAEFLGRYVSGINRCVPQKNFKGRCDHKGHYSELCSYCTRSYIKDMTGNLIF